MNEPDNYEMFMLAIMAGAIVITVYLAIRFLNPRVKKWTSKTTKKREALEKEYATYLTDDLIFLLNDLEKKRLLEMTAALNVAKTRIQDERIRLLLQQLQNSKVSVIRMRAKDIIKNWESAGQDGHL